MCLVSVALPPFVSSDVNGCVPEADGLPHTPTDDHAGSHCHHLCHFPIGGCEVGGAYSALLAPPPTPTAVVDCPPAGPPPASSEEGGNCYAGAMLRYCRRRTGGRTRVVKRLGAGSPSICSVRKWESGGRMRRIHAFCYLLSMARSDENDCKKMSL